MPALPKGLIGIYKAIRTPLVPSGSNLLRSRPEELLARLVRALLDPLGPSAKEVEALIVGCPFPEAAQGWNIARAAAHRSGRESAGGFVVSSLSTSGLEALLVGAGRVALTGGLVVSAGVDVGSRVPYGGASPDAGISYELLQHHALWPKHLAAHSFAEHAGVTPKELEAYVARRTPGRCPLLAGLPVEEDAALASASGALSVHPPFITDNGGPPLFSAAHLAVPADGGAALLLARDGTIPLRPIAFVRGVASAGANGRRAPEALLLACQKLLMRSEVSVNAVDRWWVDDSFAGVAVGVTRRLGLDPNKVNPRGSALGCGFAAGADGLRLASEAALSLQAQEGKFSVAASWSEGGTATAALFEAA